MTEPLLIDREVLLIDDEASTRDPVERYITGVDETTRKSHGIADINLKVADSVEQAKPFLSDAAKKPWDLVLLDLHLPLKSGGTPMRTHGIRLLQQIHESKAAHGVIVISNYPDFRNARATFKRGAVDFISKPFRKHHVEPAVLNTLSRLMYQESEYLLNKRLVDLIAHSQVGLAHGFRQVFFRLLRDVSETAEGIGRYALERYGLDREKDPDDPLTVLLTEHERAIATARDEWARIQSELARSSTDFQKANVLDMLKHIETTLKPALVVRKLAFTISEPNHSQMVHTFETDVEVVLREIVAGALSEMSNDQVVKNMKVRFVDEPTRVGVIFEDDLDLIPEKQAAAINEGNRIIPNEDFGRIWGLSVAQHIALRGGGEIKISSKRGWNVITYFIPRADHD